MRSAAQERLWQFPEGVKLRSELQFCITFLDHAVNQLFVVSGVRWGQAVPAGECVTEIVVFTGVEPSSHRDILQLFINSPAGHSRPAVRTPRQHR